MVRKASDETLAFEAWGVRVGLRVSESLVSAVETVLPPGRRTCDPGELESMRWEVFALEGGRCGLRHAEQRVAEGSEDEMLDLLETRLRHHLAFEATEAIFVHAGVVETAGRAIVIPGRSRTGKTTLVAALVRAGAAYYSDEYAVIDHDGRIHPFAKRLSVRIEGSDRTREVPVHDLGGVAGERPVGLGTIVATSYEPGRRWAPERRSPAEGALALLENTVVARDRPTEALAALRRAAADAAVLEGPRGEAVEAAADLLAELGATVP
jgi:hypothetical protein